MILHEFLFNEKFNILKNKELLEEKLEEYDIDYYSEFLENLDRVNEYLTRLKNLTPILSNGKTIITDVNEDDYYYGTVHCMSIYPNGTIKEDDEIMDYSESQMIGLPIKFDYHYMDEEKDFLEYMVGLIMLLTDDCEFFSQIECKRCDDIEDLKYTINDDIKEVSFIKKMKIKKLIIMFTSYILETAIFITLFKPLMLSQNGKSLLLWLITIFVSIGLIEIVSRLLCKLLNKKVNNNIKELISEVLINKEDINLFESLTEKEIQYIFRDIKPLG